MSLVGSDEDFPVKILQDIVAMDSFVLQPVLPFSKQLHTGVSVFIWGMGLNTLSVQGEVLLGVQPVLPVEGVQVILGNRLAGEHARATSSCLIVSSPQSHAITVQGSGTGEADDVCMVTCTASRATVGLELSTDAVLGDGSVLLVPDLSNLPFPFNFKDLHKKQ